MQNTDKGKVVKSVIYACSKKLLPVEKCYLSGVGLTVSLLIKAIFDGKEVLGKIQ